MLRMLFVFISLNLFMLVSVHADDAQIKSAMSAAPSSISAKSTVMDWDFKVTREGSNGWICLPNRPNTSGNDPWCINEPWLNFLKAYVNTTKPTYTEIGFAYMLKGDTPVSNADPYATEQTGPEDFAVAVEHLPGVLYCLPH